MNNKLSSVKLVAAMVGTLSGLGCLPLANLEAAPVTGSPTTQAPHYTGFLKVYSATEQRPDGDVTYRYVHTNYKVISADGKVTTWIDNKDEYPKQVTLPKGQYIVEAQSEQYGTVHIALAIKTGKTAALHLERKKDWSQDLSFVPKSDLIRLPNGDVVGIYQ